MGSRNLARWSSALAILLAMGSAAHAAAVGSDSAANYSSWTDKSNGGTGFNAWSLYTTGTAADAGHFLGDSTSLSGGSGANINTSGKSFGMYGHGTSTYAYAYRSLTSSLNAGQAFSLNMAVYFRNGGKGIDAFDSNGTQIFNFNVGGDDYVVNGAASNSGSIGAAYSSNKAFTIKFLQSSSSSGTWSISDVGSSSAIKSGTYSGLFSAFRLYVGQTDSSADANNLFTNNFAITNTTPEVSSATLFGAGVVVISLLRRTRFAAA